MCGRLEKVTIPIIRNAETNGAFLGLRGKQLAGEPVEETSGGHSREPHARQRRLVEESSGGFSRALESVLQQCGSA